MPSAFSNSPLTPRNSQVFQFNAGATTGKIVVSTTNTNLAYNTYGGTSNSVVSGSGFATFSGKWYLYNFNIGNYPIFTGNPMIGGSFTNQATNGFTTTNQGSFYMGAGPLTFSGSNVLVFTTAHIGIKMVANGTNCQIFATQADGTTENASAITTVAQGDIIDFAISTISGASATYYVWKNRVAQTPVTLSTNIPTSSVEASYNLMYDNGNSTSSVPGVVYQSINYQ